MKAQIFFILGLLSLFSCQEKQEEKIEAPLIFNADIWYQLDTMISDYHVIAVQYADDQIHKVGFNGTTLVSTSNFVSFRDYPENFGYLPAEPYLFWGKGRLVVKTSINRFPDFPSDSTGCICFDFDSDPLKQQYLTRTSCIDSSRQWTAVNFQEDGSSKARLHMPYRWDLGIDIWPISSEVKTVAEWAKITEGLSSNYRLVVKKGLDTNHRYRDYDSAYTAVNLMPGSLSVSDMITLGKNLLESSPELENQISFPDSLDRFGTRSFVDAVSQYVAPWGLDALPLFAKKLLTKEVYRWRKSDMDALLSQPVVQKVLRLSVGEVMSTDSTLFKRIQRYAYYESGPDGLDYRVPLPEVLGGSISPEEYHLRLRLMRRGEEYVRFLLEWVVEEGLIQDNAHISYKKNENNPEKIPDYF